ncbi:MAG: PAS domain-containing protein [Planctomycetaceae bacterium]
MAESFGQTGEPGTLPAQSPSDGAPAGQERETDRLFGAWRTDHRGELVDASESFFELLGVTPQEAQRHGWTKRIVPQDHEAIQNWQQCVVAGDDWEAEFRVRLPSGQERTVLAQARAVRDEAGHVTGWAGQAQDVTPRRRG